MSIVCPGLLPVDALDTRVVSVGMAEPRPHQACCLSQLIATRRHEEKNVKRKIDFDRDGLTLVGNLFTPEGFDETSNYQAVIVEGSFTSVKELMAGTYARKFAEQGFVALAFGYGRQPGWSLALNPTPALLVEHGPEALARLAGRGVAAPAEPTAPSLPKCSQDNYMRPGVSRVRRSDICTGLAYVDCAGRPAVGSGQ